MKKLFSKIFGGKTVNFLVLIVAVLVFGASFCALQGMWTAQVPPTVQVLSVTRDLPIGHIITPNDIAEKTVYEDENVNLYIPSSEVDSVVGGVVGTPLYTGQPILRPAIVADASKAYRISAVLEDYPGYSIFPLPVENQNVVAPDLEAFMVGDLVGVTAVIASRPTHPDELDQLTEMSGSDFFGTEEEVVVPTPVSFPGAYSPGGVLVEEPEGVSETEDELKKTYPPLAKDIFPQGVRVIAVQGLPESQPGATDEDAPPPAYSDYSQQKLLLLLIPNQDRETLSLALQKSDSLIVTIMARGEDGPTPGFTYWDFEEQFEVDRAEVLGIPLEELEGAPPLTNQDQSTAPYYAPVSETEAISPTIGNEIP